MTAQTLTLRTGAWYGESEIDLTIPASWMVTQHAPRPMRQLAAEEIATRLEEPVGQPPIRELARGRERPVIIVDDLNRPTPAADIMPALLAQLRDAGIRLDRVRIVMGPGTHGAPPADALLKKIGADAVTRCRPFVHNCNGRTVRVGRTSFGTPVRVNPEVAEADFVIGVGGIYPNQTAGYGGGSKAALGVLGFHTIAALHYGHPGAGWGAAAGGTFRRDLDEIAAMIGLRSTISVAVDGERRIVDVRCGDPWVSYAEALTETRDAFRAPFPEGADVVVANAYPNDLSRTFVGMKALAPLRAAPPDASRIVVAACSEGVGFHGLFPLLDPPRFHRQRVVGARLDTLSHRPHEVLQVLRRRLRRPAAHSALATSPRPRQHRHPIWLYTPNAACLPAVAGIRPTDSWEEVLGAVHEEQGSRERLHAVLYPCSPLQWLDGTAG